VLNIPEEFARAIVVQHGEAGRLWLGRLPELIELCAARWSLKVGPPFPSLSYNYAATAEGPGGVRLVLKVGVPGPELLSEMEALKVFDGRGAVRLVEADAESGALLLERLEPGTQLVGLCEADDAAATSAAACVMKSLWRPVPAGHNFPTAADWGKGLVGLREHFGGGTGPFPRRLVEEAETLFAELMASAAEPALTHGDLHHGNVLTAARAPWLAIDPKGLVAEPAYEVGALLRNPMPQLLRGPHPVRVTERRIAQLSDELGFERERVRGWGLAQAVLSEWWTVEDTGELGEWGCAVAEVIAATAP
jgi:streptomycin 6-kinase